MLSNDLPAILRILFDILGVIRGDLSTVTSTSGQRERSEV